MDNYSSTYGIDICIFIFNEDNTILKAKTDKFPYATSLLFLSDNDFLVVFSGKDGKIYFEKKSDISEIRWIPSAKLLGSDRSIWIKSLAVLSTELYGIIFSAGIDRKTYVFTNINIEDKCPVRNGILIHDCQHSNIEDVSLLESKFHGFIIASAGRCGEIFIQTMERLHESPLVPLWIIKHSLEIKSLSLINSINENEFFIVLIDELDRLNVYNSYNNQKSINKSPLFCIHVQNYMAHAHFFHEGKLRFYIASRVPTGVAVFEYEVQNLPKEN